MTDLNLKERLSNARKIMITDKDNEPIMQLEVSGVDDFDLRTYCDTDISNPFWVPRTSYKNVANIRTTLKTVTVFDEKLPERDQLMKLLEDS
jgi:hypothetical protein